MIEICGLRFSYPGASRPVFEDFTWQVEQGQAWSVIGPSGSGKTTLLYLLAGLRTPSAGQVRILGEDVAARRSRGRIGLILQEYGLLPWSTVWGNASLGLRLHGRHARRANGSMAGVEYWLKRLGIDGLRDKYPSQLSGGERQRVAIARALALEPDVMLMDEPFSALDALTRESLEHLTVSLWSETRVTTILVTHNIEEAVFVGRHILVLNHPPNRRCVVVHNPLAGRPGFQQQAAFLEKCNELRAALAEGV